MQVSVKSLMCIKGVTENAAKNAMDVISGQLDPLDASHATLTWYNTCYNAPSTSELIMSACNDILGGYGVEAVFADEEVWPYLSYVNMGDPYVNTLICLDCDRYVIGCWGDYVREEN